MCVEDVIFVEMWKCSSNVCIHCNQHPLWTRDITYCNE